MILFGGTNRWWRLEPVADYQAPYPEYPDAEIQALRSAVLHARYSDAPIYRALAIERGSDPLRAIQLQA